MDTQKTSPEPDSKPADATKTYNLPPEIGVALMTDRPEMLAMFVKRARSGGIKLSEEHLADLGQLVADLLADRMADREKIKKLEAQVEGFKTRRRNAIRALADDPA